MPEVETKTGRQSVAATVTTFSPGLAISNDPIALPNSILTYAVLHVGSGKFVATALKKREAVRIAEALALLNRTGLNPLTLCGRSPYWPSVYAMLYGTLLPRRRQRLENGRQQTIKSPSDRLLAVLFLET